MIEYAARGGQGGLNGGSSENCATTNLFEWAKEKWDAPFAFMGSLSPTNETHSSLPCREIVILLMKMAAFSAFSTA